MLADQTSSKKGIFQNLLIYCSCYAPKSSRVLTHLLNRASISQQYRITLHECISDLSDLMINELTYGPSVAIELDETWRRLNCPYAPIVDDTFKGLPTFGRQDQYQGAKPHPEGQERSSSHYIASTDDLTAAYAQLQLQNILSQSRLAFIVGHFTIQNVLKPLAHPPNNNLTKQLRIQMEVNGQAWIDAAPLAGLLWVLEKGAKTINEQFNQPYYDQCSVSGSRSRTHPLLLTARLSLTHCKMLQHPSYELCKLTLSSYRDYLAQIVSAVKQSSIKEPNAPSTKTNNESQRSRALSEYFKSLIEYYYALLFFSRFQAAQKVLKLCGGLLGVQKHYVGRMGKRTKYQSFEVPQLGVEWTGVEVETTTEQVEEKDVLIEEADQLIDLPDPLALIHESMGTPNQSTHPQDKRSILTVRFDEDSILLDDLLITEQGPNTTQVKSSNAYMHLFMLASLYYECVNSPHDEMFFLRIEASIRALLSTDTNKNSLPYSCRFSALWLRSLNQASRTKNVERALNQFELLKNALSNIDGDLQRRQAQAQLSTENKVMSNQTPNINGLSVVQNGLNPQQTNRGYTAPPWDLFLTPFLPKLVLYKHLGEKYMSFGLSMSAVQLLEQVKLYQDCIDLLIQADYRQKARTIIDEFVAKKGYNDRIWCMLGDITRDDPEPYEKAWLISQQRCARAKRSLGWIYFRKKQYAKAAQAFTSATSVSCYHANTWFTLGCCYLHLHDYQKAAKAFGESVCVDDSQGEAWGNLATCYIHLKKNKQAYSTLQQAVKHAESHWKLWSNLMSVSLPLKQFNRFYECIERVVKLGHPQCLNEEILSKPSRILHYKIEKQQRMHSLWISKHRIDRLFGVLQSQAGGLSVVYRCKSQYNLTEVEFYTRLYQHYAPAYKSGALSDVNDLCDGYQSLESTEEQTRQEIARCRLASVTNKYTELTLEMKVGWEEKKQGRRRNGVNMCF